MQDNDTKPTRRQMLMRLGLAATAIYAAPVLLQLSEARASSFSRSSNSGPSGGRRRRRIHRAGSGPSFSDGRKRGPRHGVNHQVRPRRRVVSSFSR